MDLARAVREVMESEGHGPSRWGYHDCISLIRSVIQAHGVEPRFGLPEELGICIDEEDAVKSAIRHFGGLRAGWLCAIEREPALREWTGEPLPGCVGITADPFTLDSLPAAFAPSLAVYGPDLLPMCRTPSGLAVAHPIERVWRVAA